MPKLKVKKIEVDDDIYPRQNLSQKTIKSYTEALESGADFPKIEVQKIEEGEEEKTIIIDGVHRLKAYKEAGKKEINCFYWKEEILDKEENLKDLRVEAIKKNLRHGDRLLNKDKKEMCRIMAEKDKDITITGGKFANIFGVTQKTVSKWISDIRTRQKGSRNNLIYKLSFLGWKYEDIAKKVGLSGKSSISEVFKNSNFSKIEQEYKEGKFISKIADYHGLDLQTTWAIILKDKNDEERFDLFGSSEYGNDKPKVFNSWGFSGLDDRLGERCPGNIPGQILMNLLYYYTNQGDLVVDPMAGGGSTVDACLVMNRECRAYDISPHEKRKDIKKHNISEGFPDEIEECNLIFLDPPYWQQKKGEYSEETTDLSNMSLDEFYKSMKEIFQKSYDILNQGGYITVIIGPTQEEGKIYDHAFKLYRFLEDCGFTFENRIIVPYSTQQVKGYDVSDAREGKYMMKLYRDLLVFKK